MGTIELSPPQAPKDDIDDPIGDTVPEKPAGCVQPLDNLIKLRRFYANRQNDLIQWCVARAEHVCRSPSG